MRFRFYAKGPWVDQNLDPWVTSIMVMVHFGLGIAIIVGGLERFSLPSYAPLIDYTNGNTWIWGVLIILSAILMSTPFRWANIAGLWIGMVWHIIWTACFAISSIHYPTAAATPIPAYGGLAMICAALLTARVIDKSEG